MGGGGGGLIKTDVDVKVGWVIASHINHRFDYLFML